MIPNMTLDHYRSMVREEHLPFEFLNQKKELRGKAGYSRPKNLVKYVVERYDWQYY